MSRMYDRLLAAAIAERCAHIAPAELAAREVEAEPMVARPADGEWRDNDASGWQSYVIAGKVWAHTMPRGKCFDAFNRSADMRLIGTFESVAAAQVAVVEHFSEIKWAPLSEAEYMAMRHIHLGAIWT